MREQLKTMVGAGLRVDANLLEDEQFGIGTSLSGSNFYDDLFHDDKLSTGAW
jgi:hypothetical protein